MALRFAFRSSTSRCWPRSHPRFPGSHRAGQSRARQGADFTAAKRDCDPSKDRFDVPTGAWMNKAADETLGPRVGAGDEGPGFPALVKHCVKWRGPASFEIGHERSQTTANQLSAST